MTDETTASSDGFVWQEPPRKRGAKAGRWVNAVERLRERPGEWALIGTASRNNAGTICARLKAVGCESTTRANGDGTTAIYARWPKEAS